MSEFFTLYFSKSPLNIVDVNVLSLELDVLYH